MQSEIKQREEEKMNRKAARSMIGSVEKYSYISHFG